MLMGIPPKIGCDFGKIIVLVSIGNTTENCVVTSLRNGVHAVGSGLNLKTAPLLAKALEKGCN